MLKCWDFGLMLHWLERYKDSSETLQMALIKYSEMSTGKGSGHENISRGVDGGLLKVTDGWDFHGNHRYNTQVMFLCALREGHELLVMHLLRNNKVYIEGKDDDGNKPLFLALKMGSEVVVKLLLEKGADTSSRDKNGLTPLCWAIANGAGRSAAMLLLDHGADADLASGEHKATPLSQAAAVGDLDIAELLLERGANLECVSPGWLGWRPLSWAAAEGHVAMMRFLVGKGASLTSRDSQGQTLLMTAARRGQKDAVAALLDWGSPTEPVDIHGRMALSLAAGEGHRDVAELLLDGGAAIDAPSRGNGSPLWWAAYGGHEETVRLLLDGGADRELRRRGRTTPLQF